MRRLRPADKAAEIGSAVVMPITKASVVAFGTRKIVQQKEFAAPTKSTTTPTPRT